MLTINFPHLHSYIRNELHGGLIPLKLIKDNKIILVVKAPKEMLLAAKIRKQFKIHVAPIKENDTTGFSLISAFYDTEEEPLTITTPLFIDPDTELFKEILLSDKVEIYFFDENTVEYFACRAKIELNEKIKKIITNATFVPYEKKSAKNIIKKMSDWYIYKTKEEDADAIILHLEDSLYPDDFVIIDARPSSARYVSDSEISVNQLERVEPGAYQERDIAEIFSRIFPAHCIYLNPLRTDNKEEISDLLIIGEDHILFVQAKDSPNTEKILKNSVTRKKSTTIKHLDKALRQMEGAIKYSTKSNQMKFLIGEREFSVRMDKSKICGLVVMRELFLDEYQSYTDEAIKVFNSTGKPTILLEYNELHTYTMHLTDEENLFNAFDKVFSIGKQSKIFPRLRFGLAEKE